MSSLLEVKQRLSAVWAKESDTAETYEFDFSAEKWACTRTNAFGPSKFKLAFDEKTSRLWWGQSYFMEPDDLKKEPKRLVWFRASDTVKKKGAFVWKKVRDVKLKESAVQSKPKAKAKAPTNTQEKWQPKVQPKMQSNPPAVPNRPQSKPPESEVSGRSGNVGQPRSSNKIDNSTLVERAGGNKGWPMPEVIFDLKELAVIYKPPYWKCELPEKDAPLNSGPSVNELVKRGPKDALLLLRWVKERVQGIHASLFDEEFNPALSGTGFGPLAHRIDQETSGLLLVAKTSAAQRHLKSQFWKTEVSKRYVCLVHGVMKSRDGVIDASIRTVRTDYSTRSEVSSVGERALTTYEVIATYAAPHKKSASESRRPPGYSLVACDIQTGRTHQIRVHMLHLGHPLVADDKYQTKEEVAEDRLWCPRLFLHAYRLCFRDLSNEDVSLTCPLPADLKSALTSLGVATGEGESSDLLFGDTSWQREVFRPDQSKWRPSSRIERRLVDLIINDSNKKITLNQLNSNPEFRQVLQEEGVSGIGKAWLYKHWDLFEVVEDLETDDLNITLRVLEGCDGSEEQEWERQLDEVQSELENLVQKKQRAIAEEEYQLAAELKRRIEVVTQEMSLLRSLRSSALSGSRPGLPDEDGADGSAAIADRVEDDQSKKVRRKKPEAFSQDVKDESLFPSLGGPKAAFPSLSAPSAKRAPSADRATRPGSVGRSPSPAVAPSVASSVGVAATAAPTATATTTATAATPADATPEPHVEEVDVGPPDLKQAIVDFLKIREGYVARMNEINNDKQLQQIMKVQPKRMTAVNKAWLQQHEDVFAVLHSKDGEMYIGLEAKARPKSASNSRAASADRKKDQVQTPAYRQVIQRGREEAAPPLVYDYSSAAQKDDKASEPQKDGTSEWAELFLDVLRRSPGNSCSIDDLLEAVPLFAKGIGSRKLNEQRELLLIFLQGCPKTFKLEKKGFGPDRKYYVWAK